MIVNELLKDGNIRVWRSVKPSRVEEVVGCGIIVDSIVLDDGDFQQLVSMGVEDILEFIARTSTYMKPK